MKQHIVYVIRYSILQKAKSWRLARRHDFDVYKKKLFDKERLALKRALFERFTIPSLLGQDSKSGEEVQRHVIILVSPELPKIERSSLNSLVGDIGCIELVEILPEQTVGSKIDSLLENRFSAGEHVIGTVRLDDDDALAPEFEDRLYPYLIGDYVGKTVSFSRGYELLVDSGTLLPLRAQHLNLPKIALGLTYVSHIKDGVKLTDFSNVYQLGSHDNVQAAAELVKDKSFHAYIRVAYAEQDTEAEGFEKRKAKGAKVESLSVLQEKFPSLDLA